ESTIQHINHVFNLASLSFPWQKGDIMILDNMLVAHGRKPFYGSRKVVVAMGDLCSSYGF
ncbi:TauD/TfdA family dioxygenase, partial [Bacillus atrophaeus]